MPGANSVTSNQETLHKDLEEVVRCKCGDCAGRRHSRFRLRDRRKYNPHRSPLSGHSRHRDRQVLRPPEQGREPIANSGRRRSVKRILDPRRTPGFLAARPEARQIGPVDYSVPCCLLPEPVAKAERGHETLSHAPDFSDAPCARKNNRTPYELGNLRPGICRSHKDCIRRTREVCRRNRKR